MARPRGRPKMIDTNELQVGQPAEHIIPASGKLYHEDFNDEFQTVDTPRWKDKAKALAFGEEPVKIILDQDSRPNAEQTIQLINNGVSQMIIRGVPITIKRKFVEILARAKPTTLSTPEYTDAVGNKGTKLLSHVGQKHPFRVLEDRNPDGAAWLERIFREP